MLHEKYDNYLEKRRNQADMK